jgi:hypothetical protein
MLNPWGVHLFRLLAAARKSSRDAQRISERENLSPRLPNARGWFTRLSNARDETDVWHRECSPVLQVRTARLVSPPAAARKLSRKKMRPRLVSTSQRLASQID